MLLSLLALAPLLMPQTASHSPNHLEGQTSPYLLQHVYNPVDWYPWGEEALERAQKEDKPIFLSIGYSACHWCHVMEHESFENEAIAAYLNEHFIAIKVDREERPDLDDLYMSFVQKATGSGGWPMTVFLTPERQPFFGGTYFPPEDRFGRPGFKRLLESMHDVWTNRREEVEAAAEQYTGILEMEFAALAEGLPVPSSDELDGAYAEWVAALQAVHDSQWGGFGAAPKFPRANDLRFLLLAADRLEGEPGSTARAMADTTLKAMAAGGMYDRLGGGFARYSVDAEWRIPHFEKMLYDQGTLLPAYVEAWERGGDPGYESVIRASCDYLLRERTDAGGAFWASSDADSEGVEGKFFAWTPAMLNQVLGEERGAFAAELYGVTAEGNFEHGNSVLVEARTPTSAEDIALAEEVRAALYAARLQRIAPGDDDKILTAWNGLAIDALATAGRALGEARYIEAAVQAADFLLAELRVTEQTENADGSSTTTQVWRRSWRAGTAQHRAVLEDHAYFCRGLLSLFQATGEERWLTEAEDLGRRMQAQFWNPETGIFWDTDGADLTLLHRLASPWDGATPAPNSVALECFAVLHAFTQEPQWRETLLAGASALWPMVQRNPRAFTAAMPALTWAVEEPAVAAVVGTGTAESLDAWRIALRAPEYRDALPVFRAIAAPDSALGLWKERAPLEGGATLFLCRGATCAAPDDRP